MTDQSYVDGLIKGIEVRDQLIGALKMQIKYLEREAKEHKAHITDLALRYAKDIEDSAKIERNLWQLEGAAFKHRLEAERAAGERV